MMTFSSKEKKCVAKVSGQFHLINCKLSKNWIGCILWQSLKRHHHLNWTLVCIYGTGNCGKNVRIQFRGFNCHEELSWWETSCVVIFKFLINKTLNPVFSTISTMIWIWLHWNLKHRLRVNWLPSQIYKRNAILLIIVSPPI